VRGKRRQEVHVVFMIIVPYNHENDYQLPDAKDLIQEPLISEGRQEARGPCGVNDSGHYNHENDYELPDAKDLI
jgi:hypothetical protein